MMRLGRFAGIALVTLLAACGPRPTPVPVPASTVTAVEPTPARVPTRPEPRAGHDLVYHAGLEMVLVVNTGQQGLPARVWGWDGVRWRAVDEGSPEGRDFGGAAYDSRRDVLVVYGGRTSSGCYTDTWEWERRAWRKLSVESPRVCDDFAMAYDAGRGKAVLFGGRDAGQMLHGDTWEWDGNNWTLVSGESDSTPPPRAQYALVYDSARARVLLFGGLSPTDGEMNDLWEWDGSTWREIKSESNPIKRAGASLAFDARNQVVVLFGGSHADDVLSDTWTWDGSAWTLAAEDLPPARRQPAMTYDTVRGRVVLFGGQGGVGSDASLLGDTWEWDGTQWLLVDEP
jgi:hypothetical protein